MKHFVRLLAVSAIAIVVSGCSITKEGVSTSIDSTVNAFENVCLALPSAHTNFLTIAAAFNVKQSVLDAELKVYNAGVAFCASGIVGDTAAAVKKAAAYLEQVRAAQKQVQGG